MPKHSVRALHEVPKHKRALETLREAEERFRSAFSYRTTAAEDGKIIAATLTLDPFDKKLVKRANPSRGGGAKSTDLQEVAGLPLFLVVSVPLPWLRC